MDTSRANVFERLNAAIEDWNAQLADSHNELASRIVSARQQIQQVLNAETPTGTAVEEEMEVIEAEALTALRAEFEASQASLSDAEARMEALEAELAAVQGLVELQAGAAERAEALGKALAEARADALAAAEERDALQEALSVAGEQIGAVERQLEESRGRVTELLGELEDTTALKGELELARTQLAAKHDGLGIEKLEAQVAALRAEREEILRDKAALGSEVTRLEGEAARLGGELESARSALESASGEGDALRAALDETRAALAEARTALTAAQRKADAPAPEAETVAEASVEAVASPLVSEETEETVSSVAEEPAPETPALVVRAFDARGHKKQMGTILVEAGILTEAQLEEALGAQAANPQRRFGAIVVENGYATETAIGQVLAAQLDFSFVELSPEDCEKDALALVPAQMARTHHCVPMRLSNGIMLEVALSNPLNLIAIDDLERATSCRVKPVVATASAVDAALASHYPRAYPA